MKAGRLFVSVKHTQVMLSVCVMLMGLLVVSMSAQGLVTVTKQITGLDTNGYFINGTTELSVQVTINYDWTEGTITALGYQEAIPAGFSYLGPLATENPTIPIVPNLGQTGTLSFAYIFPPSFPATFTYRIACPPAICEPGQLVGKVVYRLSGGQLESAPTTNIIQLEPTDLTFTRELSGPGVSGVNRNYYIPGKNIDVTIRIEKEGPRDITALGFQDTLPAGWTYVGLADTGTPPSVFPSAGQTDLLEFAYTDVPVFPVEFTYTVQVPADESGPVTIGGDIVVGTETKPSAVVYRTCGDSIFSPKVETPLLGVVPCLLVNRSFTRNYYVPGEVVEVTINFRINPDRPCGEAVTALGYYETIPAGWTYEGPLASENPTPPVVPNYGATGTLSFAYIYVPPLTGNGSSFTYRIRAAADSSGVQQLSGYAEYRLTGGKLYSDTVVSELIDDTPPEITLLGDPEVTVECGSEYVDAGATATDIPDGDLTAQIELINIVNIGELGTYTVDYSVTDSSNNTATAQRIVHVVDTTKPIITVLGDNLMTVECKSLFTDPGATATDNCDTNIIVNVSGSVNTNVVGEYILTYTAIDVSSNAADPVTRTVQVVDTTPPVITVTGPNPYLSLQCGTPYVDPGATATDACEGIVTVTNDASTAVNIHEPGNYTITYTAEDSYGNIGTTTRQVQIIDATPPVITITGANPMSVECGSAFTDLGATASDSCDGALTVSTVGSVDTTAPGSYTLTYRATDSAGNTGTKTRTVNVVDNTPPVITLNGADVMEHECGVTFEDPGATAVDACEGVVEIVTSGYFNENQAGDYTLTYSATDNSGNDAINRTRTVHVIDTQGPIITLNEDAMEIECGSVFEDPHAIATDICDSSMLESLTAAAIFEADTMYEVASINVGEVGRYIVRYIAEDSQGNQSTADMPVQIVDKTPPVITLLGDNPMIVECGSTFTDPGTTATDSCDASVTVVASGTVNTNVVGNYTITYTAIDDSENQAEVIRTVQVVDTQKPVITLLGDYLLVVECKSTFTDPGATVTDSCDASVAVTTAGAVNTNVVGNYTITYSATDASGNSAIDVRRIVQVVDTQKPVITLMGDNPIVVECKSTFTDPGATASDSCDASVTVVASGTVNTNVVGNYTITYTAIDVSGNKAEASRTVQVVDTIPPTIGLVGDNPVVLQVGDSYTEPVPGATAEDICDDNVEIRILSNNINTTSPGTYYVVYQAVDSSLNLSPEIIREVIVYEMEGIRTVKGQVINSISRRPVAGVSVEISIADKQGSAPILTDASGQFEFPDLGTLQPPYRLDFTKRKYQPKTVQPVNSGANLTVELMPGNIQTPIYPPRVYSGPRSVRIAWEPNPEYNIAGYNVYRRTVNADGSNPSDWERINNPTATQPYEGYIARIGLSVELQYVDTTVVVGTYYQYAIQAVSDVDRYTELSPASELVKGKWLTVFFPEQVNYKDAGMFLWERNQDNQEIQVRIPVNSKSVYDVSATSFQVASEIPADLLSVSPEESILVEPSGVTSGLMFNYNAEYNPETNVYEVLIAAAGAEAQNLYGSGTLFNIIARPNLSAPGTQCELLHLLETTKLYDVSNSINPLELELEDGNLCVTGGCIHGNANNDGVVDDADAKYILDYWVGKVLGNNCLAKSGDVNLDGLVDSADSSLIQRWLAGLSITPPKLEPRSKSYDEYIQDIMWLADSGSMAAEAILADLEKADVKVNMWLSNLLIGKKGDKKSISVFADNVSKVAGFDIVMSFYAGLAKVDSIELGSDASDLELSYSNIDGVNASGNLKVSAAGAEEIKTKGTNLELLKINFTMISDGNAELRFVKAQINDPYAHVPLFEDPKAPKILSTVPNIVGMTEDDAKTAIISAYLTVGNVSEDYSDTIPAGNVMSQSISESSPKEPGTPLDFVLSMGKQLITVPDVVGKTEAEARTAIIAVGLTVVTSQEYSDTVPSGKVISQSPAARTEVDKGTAVNLVISKGPSPVPVPDVVGKTESEAMTAITTAGLTVGTVTQEYNDTVPSGKVISQSPTAGTQVGKGTAVNLVISKGPSPVSVPDVVGKTEAEARTAITAAGLTVGTVTEEYSSDVPKGSVISQNPAAGTQVDKGSAVNLVISKGEKRRFIFSCGENSSGSGNSPIADILLIGLVSGCLLVSTKKAKSPFMN